jgi:hypothetical protein
MMPSQWSSRRRPHTINIEGHEIPVNPTRLEIASIVASIVTSAAIMVVFCWWLARHL